MKWRLFYQNELPSTNDELEMRVLQGTAKAYDVLSCSRQTMGHGRFEREWISPPGNVALSLALPIRDFAKMYQVNVIAALALIKVLDPLLVESLQLKWPNDILIGGKKLCGILSKFLPEREILVLGIGVNLNSRRQDFPSPLRETVMTLLECTQYRYEHNTFITGFLKQFAELFKTWEKKGLTPYLNDLWVATVKGHVTVHEQGRAPYRAQIIEIDKNGFLEVLTESGAIVTIVAADITTH